ELEVEDPGAVLLARLDLDGLGGDAVLLELRGDEREGQLGADQRDVRALLEEVGDAADVVLVAVGEDDALDVLEAVTDRGEVRQDHVDAGLVLLGEEHAAVDDHQLAGVLEDGHVAADLAEAAERGDAHAVLGQARRSRELGTGRGHGEGSHSSEGQGQKTVMARAETGLAAASTPSTYGRTPSSVSPCGETTAFVTLRTFRTGPHRPTVSRAPGGVRGVARAHRPTGGPGTRPARAALSGAEGQKVVVRR